jgi:glycosyltransferase involved in cell wall biosynthesis
VANEAMCQGTPVIASDAVGAAAGGLVSDGETGLVVPWGDPAALAAALRRLHDDRTERRRLGDAAQEAARALTPDAWAAGMQQALVLASHRAGSPGGT